MSSKNGKTLILGTNSCLRGAGNSFPPGHFDADPRGDRTRERRFYLIATPSGIGTKLNSSNGSI